MQQSPWTIRQQGWYLATAFFDSTSALSTIDHNGMIERKRNLKMLSPSIIKYNRGLIQMLRNNHHGPRLNKYDQ